MEEWVHTHLLKRLDIAAERFDLAVRINSSDAMALLLKGTMHASKAEGKELFNVLARGFDYLPSITGEVITTP